MWKSLKAFLLGVGVFLTALANWWEKRQEQKRHEEAQKSYDAINTDPTGEWLRRFKPESNKDETSKTRTGKP
jgi:hypothetical protein